MKIKELFNKKEFVYSFEIFPPKSDYPIDTIYSTIEELSELRPDHISVTYGAAGADYFIPQLFLDNNYSLYHE